MASDAQINANCENGKLGGVKTERGKAVVRFNARKHGILATLLTKYEEEDLEGYLQQVNDFYQPQTFIEHLLAERIAVYYLRLHRAGKAEAEFLRVKLEPRITRPLIVLRDLDQVVQEGYKPTVFPADVEHLERTYLRYETSIENRLYKAMHELERLQRMRNGESIAAPAVVDVQQDIGFVSQN